jgi:tetratricopeptide (TPR) repeat protein
MANYVVDTLAQDAYRFRDGELEQARISVVAPRDADGSDPLTLAPGADGKRRETEAQAAARLIASPRTIGRISWTWSWERVAPADAVRTLRASGHALGADVLAEYCDLFGGAEPRDATTLIPLGGLRLLESLQVLGGGRCAVILGDKAYSQEAELVGLRTPHIAVHGSFSFMANLHAMALGATTLGGLANLTPLRDGFKCACLVVGGVPSLAATSPTAAVHAASAGASGAASRGASGSGGPSSAKAAAGEAGPTEGISPSGVLGDVRQAWRAWFSRYCPEAFSALQRCVYEFDTPKNCSLRTAVSVLRLSCWDPDVAYKFRDTLVTKAESASPRLRRDLVADMARCAGAHFPLQPGKDVLFELGRVLVNIGRYAPAMLLFEESRWWSGEHHVAWYNLGLCHQRAGRFRQAAACHERSLELDPTYALAADWLRNANSRQAELDALVKAMADAQADALVGADRASGVTAAAAAESKAGAGTGDSGMTNSMRLRILKALAGSRAALAAEGWLPGEAPLPESSPATVVDAWASQPAPSIAARAGDAEDAAAAAAAASVVAGAAGMDAVAAPATVATTVTVICVGAPSSGQPARSAGVASDPFQVPFEDEATGDAEPDAEGAGMLQAEQMAMRSARALVGGDGESLSSWGAGLRHPLGVGAAWGAGRRVGVAHVRCERGASMRAVLKHALLAAGETALAVEGLALTAAADALTQADRSMQSPQAQEALEEEAEEAAAEAADKAREAGEDVVAAAESARRGAYERMVEEGAAAATGRAAGARRAGMDAMAPRGDGPGMAAVLREVTAAALEGRGDVRVMLLKVTAQSHIRAVLRAAAEEERADQAWPPSMTGAHGVTQDAMDGLGTILRINPASAAAALDIPAVLDQPGKPLRDRMADGAVLLLVAD